MPVLEHIIPCQLSSIDQRTNAVSLFNIIDTLSVLRHPGQATEGALVSVPIEVVTTWRRGAGDREEDFLSQIISLVLPDGNEEEIERLDFQIFHYRHRLHVQLPPVSVLSEGVYTIKVTLEKGSAAADLPGSVLSSHEYPIQVEITDVPLAIDLTNEELALLRRPVKGEGGFQSLLRRIQNQIAGTTLVLSEPDARRLLRYAQKYTTGGFQQRLGAVVKKVQLHFEDG